MRNSEILQPIEPHKARPDEEKKDEAGTQNPEPKPEKKDPGVLKPGVSGTVQQLFRAV